MRSGPDFGVCNNVKVRRCHLEELFIGPACGDLADVFYAGISQEFLEFSVFERREISDYVDALRILFHRFKERIQGLPYMDHGRPSAFPGKRVHIARPDSGSITQCPFACGADSFHVCSEKRVHTGDADHDDLRFLSFLSIQERHYFTNCFRDPLQMSSGYEVSLIHH